MKENDSFLYRIYLRDIIKTVKLIVRIKTVKIGEEILD